MNLSKIKKLIVSMLPPSLIFNLTYKRKWWGEGNSASPYYSGSGTYTENVIQYKNKLVEFIKHSKVSSVVEIGCGDFSIMKDVLQHVDVTYTGIDVSSLVVEYNTKHYKTEKISFVYADASTIAVPQGDLLIIRQVLQHLNNQKVARILTHLPKFKFALITEHQTLGSEQNPNVNINTGPNTRLSVHSGLYLDLPPFNVPDLQNWFEFRKDETIDGVEVQARIRTYLFENPKN
jgi:SAM-dependent methyltransferase